jgi:hypothetical protein
LLYIRHRVRRLPDTPEKIARGIWAGVFTTFTPFYGLHFILSLILARLMNGNILAALLATFFGNPLTYVPIGVVSLSTGHFLLGTEPKGEVDRSIVGKFFDAWSDLWANGRAVFTEETANWDGLAIFYNDIFLPYTVGGIAPGIIAGSIAYYLSVPVIRAYQNRRKGRLARKLPGLARRSSGTGGALRHGRDEPRQ